MNVSEMKNVFCCEGLQAIVEDPKCALKYRAYTRDFILTVPEYLRVKKKNVVYSNYKLSHCPRCGTKFPESLADEWYDIIEKELGIDGLIGQDQEHLIPEEYKTDEWWKKRRL
jgi:hypothetical protein